MSFYFGTKSINNYQKIHPDLVAVFKRALEISEVDFAIIEGARTLKRQEELLASKDTWTLNSRHIIPEDEEKCFAGDLAAYIDGMISWKSVWYDKIAKAMFKAAIELKVQIEWGGFWNKKDKPHWQLSRKEYPVGKHSENDS